MVFNLLGTDSCIKMVLNLLENVTILLNSMVRGERERVTVI